jgi:hypothetical protein
MAGLLRLASTVATILVALGFVLFAVDATHDGSADTVARIADPGADEQVRERASGGFRELVDDANDILLAPFDGVVAGSGSQWARHGVSALLGFLAYGLALRLLANALPRARRPEPLGWDAPR